MPALAHTTSMRPYRRQGAHRLVQARTPLHRPLGGPPAPHKATTFTHRPTNSRADDGRSTPPFSLGEKVSPKATDEGWPLWLPNGESFRLARAQGASPRTLIRRAKGRPEGRPSFDGLWPATFS